MIRILDSRASDWSTECKNGSDAADALIAKMVSEDNPLLLTSEVRRIVGSGQWTGIEVGFFHRISELLMMR